MRIACLGWGSLIWDQRELPVENPWQTDGPELPIEFARQSADGRVTLVIVPGTKPLPVLWSLFSLDSIDDAQEALRKRERTPNLEYIGCWCAAEAGGENSAVEQSIANWAAEKKLDAVVWTALPSKWNHVNGRMPSVNEVIRYLRELNGAPARLAREYVTRAPVQIMTDYRKTIAKDLGWTSWEVTE